MDIFLEGDLLSVNCIYLNDDYNAWANPFVKLFECYYTHCQESLFTIKFFSQYFMKFNITNNHKEHNK